MMLGVDGKIFHIISEIMWNQFRTKCLLEQRYDNETKHVFQKKAKKLITSSLYEAREKNKQPGWIRKDAWIKFLAIWDNVEFKEKSERAKAARASQKGGSLHARGSMSFVAHRQTEIGGVSKGRVYGLGVQRPSSFRPSPLLSDAPIVQNQKEMGAMQKKIELLSKRCETFEAHIARMDKYIKKKY